MSVPVGLRGIDFSQYASWPSFVGSDGHTYYIPPGGEGYAYDPFLNHLFQDGRKAKADAQKAIEDQNNAVKDANSPVKQFETLGGVAGITAGIPILANKLFPNPLEAAIASKIAPSVTTAATGAITAPSAFSGLGAASQTAFNAGALGTGSEAAGAAATAAAPAAEESGIFGSLLPSSAGIGGLGFGPLAAIAAGTFLGGKGLLDEFNGKTPNILSRGILDIASGGLNEVALHFLNHETTREHQQKNTQDLLAQSNDPTWQGYVTAMRGQNETGPSDAAMPYGDSKGNKYANFDDYKKAGLDPANLTGVVGNLQTYGPAWAKLTEAQRQAITQKNIEANLYSSKKGEVVITDPTLAKQNFDSVATPAAVAAPAGILGNTPIITPVPVANIGAAAQGAAPVVVHNAPPRTITSSPGINLRGQRIVY